MEFIKSECKKCGYEIIMPEKSENVICGSCGTINSFSKISSILKKYSDSLEPSNYKGSSGNSEKIPDEDLPAGWKNPDKADLPASDDEEMASPDAKKISKIMTVLFILAPFIAMAIDFFKLPSYTALLFIVFIIGIIFFLRRG